MTLQLNIRLPNDKITGELYDKILNLIRPTADFNHGDIFISKVEDKIIAVDVYSRDLQDISHTRSCLKNLFHYVDQKFF